MIEKDSEKKTSKEEEMLYDQAATENTDSEVSRTCALLSLSSHPCAAVFSYRTRVLSQLPASVCNVCTYVCMCMCVICVRTCVCIYLRSPWLCSRTSVYR